MNTVEPIKKTKDLLNIAKILKEQSFRDFLLFKIGINWGLRISDILALNVGDVKGKKYVVIKEIKTQKYKRIAINSDLICLLKEYTCDKDIDEPLFTTKYKNKMDRITAYRILKKACLKANVEANIGTHSLRKTFGYHFYKKFNDIALLQKIFNHSTPRITLRYIGIEQEEIDYFYRKFIL